MENFRSPNFALVAEVLMWLVRRSSIDVVTHLFEIFNAEYKIGWRRSSSAANSLIIHMKKLLNSDWLRAVWFRCNIVPKKCNTGAKDVTPVQIRNHAASMQLALVICDIKGGDP